MRRGTRVGEAYVAVTADGSGINKEIVDGVDEAGPGVERSGKEHGERYGEGFGDGLDLDDVIDRLGNEMGKRLDRQADKMGNSFSQRFGRALDKANDKLGASLAEALQSGLDDTLESFARMVDTMESRLKDVSGNGGGGTGSGAGAGNQQPGAKQVLYKSYDFASLFEAARIKLHADANKAIEADDAKLLKSQQSLYDSVLKMEQGKADFISKFETARERLREKSNAVILKDDQDLAKSQQKLFDSIQKEAIKRDADLWTQRRATAKAHYKYLDDLEKGRTDERGVNIPGGGKRGTGIGDELAGMFGAGSRNNFLNLFGKSLGGIVNLTEKGATAAAGLGQAFTKGFNEADEGASLFSKTLSGFSGAGGSITKGLGSIASAGPAAAVGIIVVVDAMILLTSTASALLGLLTALVATITSALVGGLLVLGGALGAAAAAASLLVVAFTSMTDAQSALLSSAFQPLKAELTGIGQLMITQMIPYFQIWSDNLQRALVLVAPLASVMGTAFGQAGASLTAALSGPGFQKLLTVLGQELPTIVMNLSSAFGSLANGIAAVFAAILPDVTSFSGYLADVTQRFSEWANSAAGQNAIVDFVDRALDSLQSLWNFVREFSGFVADVLFSPEAQQQGNSMFDTLADAFERFREKIADGSLEKWFSDAARLGSVLWKVMGALGDVIGALVNSGALDAVVAGFEGVATVINILNPLLSAYADWVGFVLPSAMAAVIGPLKLVADAVEEIGDAIAWTTNLINKVPGVSIGGGGSSSSSSTSGGYNPLDHLPGTYGNGLGVLAPEPTAPGLDLSSLINTGNTALNNTSISSGGYKPKPTKPQYQNPYVAYANSLIDEGPSAMTKVRQALRKANRTFAKALQDSFDDLQALLRRENTTAAKAIRDAVGADNTEGVVSALTNAIESMRSQAANAATQIRSSAKSTADSLRNSGDSVVQGAQSTLNSAASSLASASSAKAAAAALAKVKRAQKALDEAEKAANKLDRKADRLLKRAKARAKKAKEGEKAAEKILSAQRVYTPANAQALINGAKVVNATLADYAAAREFVADQLTIANQKLADAIALRDNYATSVSDSAKSFGSILTAQAQVINGVAQSLTYGDITTNLQDRLDKIKKFQENLRILLASGLSNDAYKQLVDAGVEQGGAYAQALVEGGQGAISETNNLTGQIGSVADQLGIDASTRLYQAGVNAAQGLVDGLESLGTKLDAAAYKLGTSIAAAVKRALGIKSPSRVLRADMGYVGDGIELGLDDQHNKVGAAASRLSSKISVSPEVAAYAARQGEAPTVSGNSDPRFRDLIVHTPTENPEAVAMEVLNEVTGRL